MEIKWINDDLKQKHDYFGWLISFIFYFSEQTQQTQAAQAKLQEQASKPAVPPKPIIVQQKPSADMHAM